MAPTWILTTCCFHLGPLLDADPASSTLPTLRLSQLVVQLFGVVPAAWGLQPEAFRGDGGSAVGVLMALLAGLSQAIGQAFILFLNRVRPLRFLLSLLLEALLFALGFLVWATSTWGMALLVFRLHLPLAAVVRALGIAHAPQLLGFLGALPYLGTPWLTLLSLWTAVSFVVGMAAVTGLPAWSALASLIGGWWAMHALQRLAGQPLSHLVRRLERRAAGVNLERDSQRLVRLVGSERHPASQRRPPR